STAIALAFVGAAVLAGREISNFRHDYEGKLNVSVFLCAKPTVVPGQKVQGPCKARYTAAQRAALQAKRNADPMVTKPTFMLETIVATLIGGMIAIGLIWIGKQFVLNNVFKVPVENGVIPNLGSNDILVAGGLGIIAGILLAGLTAFATLRLYVKL